MATTLPPPPTNDQTGSYAWLEWFRQLRAYITVSGSVPWSIINFAGSSIADIATRSHQLLQALQGGTTGEYYHLTNAEYTALGQEDNVQSVAVNTSLTDAYKTTYVTATGKTITLPPASAARIGRAWNIIFTTSGTCTVVCAGADTFAAPSSATETTLVMTVRGQSVVFKCLSATTWGIE